ncbi:hypothetical protein ACFQ9T_13995 [Bacillus cereus]
MNIHFEIIIYMGAGIFKSVKWKEEYYVHVDVLTIQIVYSVVNNLTTM